MITFKGKGLVENDYEDLKHSLYRAVIDYSNSTENEYGLLYMIRDDYDDHSLITELSDNFLYGAVHCLICEEYTDECNSVMQMYLIARYEYIDIYGEGSLDWIVPELERTLLAFDGFPGVKDLLKEVFTYRVNKVKADIKLVDKLLSTDNIRRILNNLFLADDNSVKYYVKNASYLLDQMIADSLPQNQKSESQKSEEIRKSSNEEDSDQNIINIDFSTMLIKYNITAIDTSIIQYYQAIQQWTSEIMDKLNDYEQKMAPLIHDFNQINLKLSKKYENNPYLTDEENTLLLERQLYFQKKFSLSLNNAKSKILAVKKQADNLESRIDEINNGEDSIHELALLEKEERASFSFVAENTARIIKNAIQKIEYFQNNRQFITNVTDLWEKWSEEYRIFKTTYHEDLKTTCEEDGIEEDIWGKWYGDWQKIRFAIEQRLQPMIERSLKAPFPTVTETEISIPEQSIRILDDYKHMVDIFFIEDRKGIYQKFAFQPGGELQEKFETESELYKCTASLQNALQKVIFNCKTAEDRVFILKWINSLLDIQIDELLDFITDKDLQQFPETLLSEFTTLKQKNYDIYLTDAEAYNKEKARREKEYNSLVFKMRKDLMK